MEQPANKFHNGKIYAIRSYQTPLFYIGSTRDALHKRLYSHRALYETHKNGKTSAEYRHANKILQYEDHYIELLEDFKCENKQQLCKREGELMRLHKDNCVNTSIAGRTKKEYDTDNIEKLKDYRSEYYSNNSEKIKNYNKERYINNAEIILNKNKQKYKCDCGSEIRKDSKLEHDKSKKHIKYMATLN